MMVLSCVECRTKADVGVEVVYILDEREKEDENEARRRGESRSVDPMMM